MDDKDPSPFGYTFAGDFFGTSAMEFDNAGPSLLNELESQSLEHFFTNTNHWPSEAAPSGAPPLPPTTEAKTTADDMGNWSLFPPPATIHSVSTTIPDQAQLHGFHADDNFGMQHPAGQFNHTPDDLQAASTLFSNAHMPAQSNGRAYSFHGTLPNPTRAMSAASNGLPPATTPPSRQPVTGFHSMPTVPTSQGHINEQLAALIPHHEMAGSVDAELATQWANSDARRRHQAELQELGLQRPQLKRSYTYGTDSAFNETGFQVSSKHQTEEYVTKRIIRGLHHASGLDRQTPTGGDGAQLLTPTGQVTFPIGRVAIPSDGERQSDEDSWDDDEESDRPSKKRRKSKVSISKNGNALGSRGGGKNRKASLDDRVNKKKRGSVAGQKAQRENLSEEQKRSNHILSEQKRRNLIKRGFDDLHDLVPEIRSGGLSKSAVLTEAANFLEKLIAENKQYLQLIEGPEG